MTTVMGLTDEQVTEYKEQGWVVLPSVFSREELSVLERTSEEVLKRPGPEVAREADGSPHVCWGMHLFDERF
ncbi:MAG: proline hydroxylase, partial [Pseudomonadota bacterium]|nr:proline hydroxylase [Pseudomonadota bacterium]